MTLKRVSLKKLSRGTIYRLKRCQLGGYNYFMDYDRGRYIDLRVLSGPDEFGCYEMTTRDRRGRHIGNGGGWAGRSVLYLRTNEVDRVHR